LALHSQKEYKIETLFIACNIFDRYLALEGHWNFTKENFITLATVCMILGAKCEEDTSPSINRMINLLSCSEQRYVTKKAVIDLEASIVLKFGFEFNYIGPIESSQRYLRLINKNKNEKINKMC